MPDQASVRLDWSATEACPAQHVDQVLVHMGPPSEGGVPDGIYVAMGSISPPVIPADPERTASAVKVAVYGRVTMSREVLDDLIRLLKAGADQYDAAVALARHPSAREGAAGSVPAGVRSCFREEELAVFADLTRALGRLTLPGGLDEWLDDAASGCG